MTIVDILQHRAATDAERVAYGFIGNRGRDLTTLTYAQLVARVSELASRLNDGCAPDQPVGCMAAPGLNFVVAFLACLWSGRPAVPVAPPRTAGAAEVVSAILADCGASVCLSTTDVWESFSGLLAAAPGTPARRWIDVEAVQSHSHTAPIAGKNPTAFFQYTSGSIADPKGVMISHQNLLRNSQDIANAFGHSRSSVGVIWLPPVHDMGLVGGIVQPLFVGFPVYLMSPVEFMRRPLTWLEAISRFRATTSGGPCLAYDECVRRVADERKAELDLSSWEVAFCGAEPISLRSLRSFSDAFGSTGFKYSAFMPCYGMAESTLMVTTTGLAETPTVLSPPNETPQGVPMAYVNCGAPQPGVTVRIVDPATGAVVPDGTRGEVWVSSASIASGYWNKPAETLATFSATLAEQPGKTFLRTGDLGFLVDGALYICGRLRAMVIINGKNHNLEDIERTVADSDARLPGYVCLAFPVHDDKAERLYLVQEAPPAMRSEDGIAKLEGEIRNRLFQRHGIQPSAIRIVPLGTLERTTSGKPKRGVSYRHLFEDAPAAAPA